MQNLELLVKATCLRRTKAQVDQHLPLPPRVEEVQWIDLSPPDRVLYEYFKDKTARIAAGLSATETQESRVKTQNGYRKGENIIRLINILRLICDHGEMLLPESALEAWRNRQNDSIDWETMQKWSEKQCNLCGQDSIEAGSPGSHDAQFLCGHVLCSRCVAGCEEEEGTDTAACPICGDGYVRATASPSVEQAGCRQQRSDTSSNKVLALVQNIREEQRSQAHPVIKSVVFSYWAKMLNLVQHALELAGFSVARIDGQKSLQDRATAISRFSRDPECTVMLATIGSAGEGIDLTPASCVHLLEPQWNPMVEAQAVDRVHRIGQTRPVKTTRYITSESVETYVQWVQKEKVQLINRSLAVGLGEDTQTGIDDQRWRKLQECLGGTGAP